MKWERTAAILGLFGIAVAALAVGAVENVEWAKDIALVSVGGLAGVITAPVSPSQ